MIRLEIKVEIPDHRKKEEFLKSLLDIASEDSNSFFWQNHFDVIDGDRASLEAVLGKDGFPFLQGDKLLILTCDFATEKQLQKAYSFFKRLALSWHIEMTKIPGERLYGDLFDEIDEFDE